MDKIEIGDKVVIQYVNGAMRFAKVIHTPSGPGDLWQFESEPDGKIFAQNPYSKNLDYIEKRGDV